jgi:hypothetical protein
MRLKSVTSAKGFSTLELISIIVISGILVGIMSQLMVFGADSYEFMANRKSSLHESRLAVHYLNRDLRKIRDLNSIVVASGHRFKFHDYENNLLDYHFLNSEIQRNSHTLAMNVSQFQFDFLQSDGSHLSKPVSADLLEFVWDIEVRFTVSIEDHHVEYRVFVHPRSHK